MEGRPSAGFSSIEFYPLFRARAAGGDAPKPRDSRAPGPAAAAHAGRRSGLGRAARAGAESGRLEAVCLEAASSIEAQTVQAKSQAQGEQSEVEGERAVAASRRRDDAEGCL